MADFLNRNLQPASFRGVPFHVEAAGVEAGRRTQTHEYPKRDKPWTEDLGRATRGFTVDAFVVGANYIAEAKALIAASEVEGPGTLVHPWLGTMQVSLKDVLRVRFDAAAGLALVGFSFVEPGELEFPSAEASTPAQSQICADTLSAAAADSFGQSFGVENFPAFVRDLASVNLSAALSYVSNLANITELSSWAGQLGGYVAAAQQLMGLPYALGAQVMEWLDLSGIVALYSLSAGNAPTYATASVQVATVDPLAAIVYGLVGVGGSGGAGGVLNAPTVPAAATPARAQQIQNTAAINGLVRCGLLAQAVGISSHVDATVQTDAQAVRNALCAALDRESLVADDTTYEALQSARRAVWTDLTARSSGGARVVDLVNPAVQPAVVIAYERYEDAGRGDEIVARNGLVHPGFVPMQTLKVLSR